MEVKLNKEVDVEVTQADFLAYEEVRQEGLYNMLDSNARMLTGLDKDVYMAIIKHYGTFAKKWLQ